jgi:WD40 repeat protein
VRFHQIILAAWLTLVCAISTAFAEKRVALVIGNDRYANLASGEQLQKAVNDARAVGGALKQIGFDVAEGENLGRQALIDRLDEAAQRVTLGDTAFFFFAGHGVAVDGVNYLLPADVPAVGTGQITRLTGAALAEDTITAAFRRAGARVAVVVIDACRNNPFGASGTRGIGGERGLQPVPPPRGVFTLYSAGRGEVALDRLSDSDRNLNSVFTRVLLPALTRADLDLPGLAVEVREEVTRLAESVGHAQSPAYYDETRGGRIFLAMQAGLAPVPSREQPAPPLARRSDDAVQVPVRTFGNNKNHALAVLSPDGSMVAAQQDSSTQRDKPVKLWDAASGRELRTLKGFSTTIGTLAFSPDGRTLAIGADGVVFNRAPDTLRLWDVPSSTARRTISNSEGQFWSVAFSPDGSLLATGGPLPRRTIFDAPSGNEQPEGWIKILDARSGDELRAFTGRLGSINSLAFSPDGQTLVSGGRAFGNDSAGEIKFWDVRSGQELSSLTTTVINAVAFSPDGRHLVSGGYCDYDKVQSRCTGSALKLWEESLKGPRVWDGSLKSPLDPTDLISLRRVRVPRDFTGQTDPVHSVAFSPDGRLILSGGNGGMKLWDVSSGQLLHEFDAGATVFSVNFSPDGRFALTGNILKPAKLWDISEWTQH